jgi:DNA-binding transcriptional regulator GbsR (MarR family)
MKSAAQPLIEAASDPAESTAVAAGFEKECIELFTEAVAAFGAPPSLGQIYGVIFASPQPLSFTDIFERLGISKGSVSQGLQTLRSLGAVRSVAAEDTRREYFVAEIGLRRLVDGALRERIGPLVSAAPARIVRLQRLAQRDLPDKTFYLGQVEQIETWRRRITMALPLLSVLLGRTKRRR